MPAPTARVGGEFPRSLSEPGSALPARATRAGRRRVPERCAWRHPLPGRTGPAARWGRATNHAPPASHATVATARSTGRARTGSARSLTVGTSSDRSATTSHDVTAASPTSHGNALRPTVGEASPDRRVRPTSTTSVPAVPTATSAPSDSSPQTATATAQGAATTAASTRRTSSDLTAAWSRVLPSSGTGCSMLQGAAAILQPRSQTMGAPWTRSSPAPARRSPTSRTARRWPSAGSGSAGCRSS